MFRIGCAAALLAFLTTAVVAQPERWRAEDWKTDFSRAEVPYAEILSGGPPRDGIPSIDAPKFRPASQVGNVEELEPVIRLSMGGETRAYPLQVLTWHEIANDIIGGVPVAVTYCPLCNAALVFDRRLDGQVLEFGTTGKLRHSDLVMYDRQTESWWQQFTGTAIFGELAGKELRLIPSRIVSFGVFRAEFPDGDVLVPNDPDFRDYGRNPYASYDSSASPFLYRGDLPPNISPMSRVVVVRTETDPIIVSLEKVRREGFEKGGYRIRYEAGVASALDNARIARGRDVGTVVVTRGENEEVVHDVTFAFVAHAFHPETPIIAD